MANDKNKGENGSPRSIHASEGTIPHGQHRCFLASCDKPFEPTVEHQIFHHEDCRIEFHRIERTKGTLLCECTGGVFMNGVKEAI